MWIIRRREKGDETVETQTTPRRETKTYEFIVGDRVSRQPLTLGPDLDAVLADRAVSEVAMDLFMAGHRAVKVVDVSEPLRPRVVTDLEWLGGRALTSRRHKYGR